MQKKFDFSNTYAIALGGGGAKGAYEIGVWRSLEEEGLKYNAVSGTSVGALNGAMMAMRDLERAESLWRNIRFSQVMDVDDDAMTKLFEGGASPRVIRSAFKKAVDIMKEGGFDVSPLRELMRKNIDTSRIKNSDVDFFIVTYSLTDKKGLDIAVKSLPEESICDMLLASAYYPAFKNEPLAGKRFTDGGLADVLPVTPLLEHGYRNIIAIRLTGGFGREKRVRAPRDARIQYIEPQRKLGSTLNFSPAQAAFDMTLGYYDAKRFVYGLVGERYYLERTMSEEFAYSELMKLMREYADRHAPGASLRTIHEEIIPKFAKKHGAVGDYYDVLIKYLEHSGEVFSIPEFRLITDAELLSEVRKALADHGMIKTEEA